LRSPAILKVDPPSRGGLTDTAPSTDELCICAARLAAPTKTWWDCAEPCPTLQESLINQQHIRDVQRHPKLDSTLPLCELQLAAFDAAHFAHLLIHVNRDRSIRDLRTAPVNKRNCEPRGFAVLCRSVDACRFDEAVGGDDVLRIAPVATEEVVGEPRE